MVRQINDSSPIPICDVFLGGTCNNSKWRDEFIEIMKKISPGVTMFNPVVDDCIKEEYRQKDGCSVQVYCITPRMTGVFSIAELIDASNKKSDHVVCILLDKDDEYRFDKGTKKSIEEVFRLADKNGAYTCRTIRTGVEIVSDIISADYQRAADEQEMSEIFDNCDI